MKSPYDGDPRWDVPTYDALSDFHGSHVNPILWRRHGWVDDRIDDQFQTHEAFTSGSASRKAHKGIQWIVKGQRYLLMIQSIGGNHTMFTIMDRNHSPPQIKSRQDKLRRAVISASMTARQQNLKSC